MVAREVAERLIPGIDDLNALLMCVRQKHDLPDLTIADKETIEAVKSDPKYDWEAIRQDVEKGLVELFEKVINDVGLNQLILLLRSVIENSWQMKSQLTGDGLGVPDDLAEKLVEGAKKEAESSLEFLHQFYVQSSIRLVEHLRTGSPIDVPAKLFNFVFTVNVPSEDIKFVAAIGLEYNDPEEMAEDLYTEMKRQFPAAPRFTEKDIETADYLAMKRQGKELVEITRIDIMRHPEVMEHSIDDPGYDREFDNRKETLNSKDAPVTRGIR